MCVEGLSDDVDPATPPVPPPASTAGHALSVYWWMLKDASGSGLRNFVPVPTRKPSSGISFLYHGGPIRELLEKSSPRVQGAGWAWPG